MATWKDGPRYAPLTRPIAFAEPATAVSLAPAEAPAAVEDFPTEVPEEFAPQGTQIPLESVVPTPASVRDPSTPFSTATLLMADEGSSTGERTATQPYHVVSSLPVVTSTWAAPAPAQAPVPVVRQVSPGDCWAAAYPPFVITMAVVGIVGLVQSFIAVALLAASPFIFVPRVRFRVTQLRNVNIGILAVLFIGWIVTLVLDSSMYNMDLDLSAWVLVGCWALAVVDIFLQWLGLRNGETPNHT